MYIYLAHYIGYYIKSTHNHVPYEVLYVVLNEVSILSTALKTWFELDHMGVNHLWNILEPVKRKESLSSLCGKTLCVDLSGWICEAQCAKALKANVNKPHLRNLLFRVLHLTRLGIRLVFVVDGVAPELKRQAIVKRSQARFGVQAARAQNRGGKVGRSHFKVMVNEVRI